VASRLSRRGRGTHTLPKTSQSGDRTERLRAPSHAISSLMSSFAGTDLAATMNCGPSEISAASVIEK
jgi:hypothetical protein